MNAKKKIIQQINEEIAENIEEIFSLEEYEKIHILEQLPEHYKDDAEIMLGIMKDNEIGPLLSYCSDRLKNDMLFVYEAVKIEEQNFSQASVELQNNKQFVLQCIELPKFLIEDAPEHFLDDKDCAIAAIKRKGIHVFKKISERLKDDKDIAIAAINYQPICYHYFSDRLKNDKDIVLLALTDESLMASIPSRYRDDKEVMVDFFNIKQNPQYLQNLQYVSKNLKNDIDVVISAIKTDRANFKFAGKRFKQDKKLATLIIQNNGSLEYLSSELRSDKDMVLLACKYNLDNFQYASEEIREEIGDNNPVSFIESQKLYNTIDNRILTKNDIKKTKKKI